MELYNLGKVPWEESQIMYHALARLGRESLCLVSPATPYVCIGFHQDVEQELKRCEQVVNPACLDDNPVFMPQVLGKTGHPANDAEAVDDGGQRNNERK